MANQLTAMEKALHSPVSYKPVVAIIFPDINQCSEGGTNHELDLQNPDNLGQQSTDNGVVPNLKWSFSDSKTRILRGGWVREQVVTDLPSSKEISSAQQHLTKGSIRELHWHRVVRHLQCA